MKQKYKKILSLIGLSFFVANLVFVAATPVMIYAQAVPTPAATPPPASTATPTPPVAAGEGEKSIEAYLCTPGTGIYTCINKLYRFALAAAFFITVLFIVFAGYQYMLGGEKGKEDAKGRISAAVVAIVILSTSYILLRQINPDLVKFKNISPLPVDLVSKLDDLSSTRGGDIPTLDQWTQGPNSNNGTGTPGADIKTCPDPGPVVIPTDVAGRAGEKACQNLIDALRSMRQSQGVNFIVTDAFGSGHQSSCHTKSGTCADIVPTGNTNWEALCKGVVASGQFRILNEYSGNDAPTCGVYKDYGNKDHLHIILQNTADDLENDSSATGSDGLPGVTKHTGVYPSGDWTGTNASAQAVSNLRALLTAFNKLKEIYPDIGYKQVYRPPEYGVHLRSVWEAYHLVVLKQSTSTVGSTGYKCNGNLIVKPADVAAYNGKPDLINALKKEYNPTHFTRDNAPTTCDSDHGYGAAIDITGYTANNKFIQDAISVGLCHNIPDDAPHFVLSSFATGQKCDVPFTTIR